MKSLRFAALAIALLTSAPILAAGAIAVDTEHGQKAGDEGYGIGWGKTRDAAARDALKQCSSAGNTNCKVLARFDTCGAYASHRLRRRLGRDRGRRRGDGAREVRPLQDRSVGVRVTFTTEQAARPAPYIQQRNAAVNACHAPSAC